MTVGLILEFGDKEEYPNARELRRSRRNKKWGEILVIVGVGLETLVAFAMAGKDVWENRQTAIDISKNAPINQPVLSAFARVELTVTGTNDIWQPWYTPPVAAIAFSRRGVWPMIGLSMDSQKFEKFFDGPRAKYILDLQTRSSWMLNPALKNATNAASMLRDIDWIMLQVHFLPYEFELVTGRVSIVLNSSVRREFPIPKQKTSGLNQALTSVILSNETCVSFDPDTGKLR